MRNRIQQVSILMILAGAAVLVGCASAQTTQEYAASRGLLRVKLEGRQYYCLPEQTEVTNSDPSKIRWFCLTTLQVMQLRLAGSPVAYVFSSGGAADSGGGGFGSSGAFSGTYQR